MKTFLSGLILVAALFVVGPANAKSKVYHLKDGTNVRIETRMIHGKMMAIVPADFLQHYMSMSEGHDLSFNGF